MRLVTAILGVLIIYVILALPDRPELLNWPHVARLPVEFFVLIGGLLFCRRRARFYAVLCAVIVLTVALFAKGADFGMQIAAGRPFDLVLDAGLLLSVRDLAVGTYGFAGGALRIAALVFGVVVLLHVLRKAVGWVAELSDRTPDAVRYGVLCLAVIAIALPLFKFEHVQLVSTQAVLNQAVRAGNSAGDLHRFTEELKANAAGAVPANVLLSRLRDTDVSVIFIESYGASLLDDPAFRERTDEALADFRNRLSRIGWSAKSAFLESTTMGGQSWLAHSSFLSGARVDNQGRYKALTASNRATLISDFRRAGWTTAAVMPAIVAPWDEAKFYGYDKVFAATDLDYRGKSFDWVTMPDQFTLASFERQRPASPVMTEFALLSSHIPWSPLPSLLPWSEIGDGRVFNAQVEAGEPPDVVWHDIVNLRQHYLTSIVYVLNTLASYVEQFGARRQLIVILGDHPPIPLVAGEGASRAVPVHILASDPALLALLDGWNWTSGMHPAPDAPLWPMETFRDRFVTAFSAPVQAAGADE